MVLSLVVWAGPHNCLSQMAAHLSCVTILMPLPLPVDVHVLHAVPPLSLSLKQVTDTQGHILFQREDVSNGKFSFTTEDYEMFDICFTSHTQGGQCVCGVCVVCVWVCAYVSH